MIHEIVVELDEHFTTCHMHLLSHMVRRAIWDALRAPRSTQNVHPEHRDALRNEPNHSVSSVARWRRAAELQMWIRRKFGDAAVG